MHGLYSAIALGPRFPEGVLVSFGPALGDPLHAGRAGDSLQRRADDEGTTNPGFVTVGNNLV